MNGISSGYFSLKPQAAHHQFQSALNTFKKRHVARQKRGIHDEQKDARQAQGERVKRAKANPDKSSIVVTARETNATATRRISMKEDVVFVPFCRPTENAPVPKI